ncbi:hypothetical protein [Streptomyces sp. NPDC001435]|uniref:hypothetical protein n=1 Tax=unclassified Streptomyces TaxID=2593676 RepID=UPI00367C561B
MKNDLDTLLTALYVKIDDDLGSDRRMGRPPRLTDSELVCLAVAQALLGFASETRWLHYAHAHLASMFPYLPQQSGYNKRLRAALPLVKKAIRMLAVDTDFWFDTHWIVDSTPGDSCHPRDQSCSRCCSKAEKTSARVVCPKNSSASSGGP